MSEKDYEELRKRFESRPPFVFYFNPNIELQERVNENDGFMKGFIDEETNVSANRQNKLEILRKFCKQY